MEKLEKLFKKNLSYKIENNKYIFKQLEFSEIEDNLDKLKGKLKKYSKFYTFLIKLISPVNGDNGLDVFIDKYAGDNVIALNVGSGNSDISKKISNVDIFAYDNVDVVCDIEDLPFTDNSIDVVLNITVLEHVPDPKKVLDEIFRVLKPGGVIYTAFPFIQAFHASPYDFTRVTEEGIKVLHSQFNELEVRPFGGPTSGMLWIMQEWLAILLSFGSKKIHLVIFLILMCITFPIKYLDYLLIKHPLAKNIASGFIYIGRKA